MIGNIKGSLTKSMFKSTKQMCSLSFSQSIQKLGVRISFAIVSPSENLVYFLQFNVMK